MRSFAAMLALLTALLSAVAHAEPIERIRPSDGIASIRISTELGETAIHITFAEDMIPLGGGHAGFPVRLEGHGGCDWGWRGPRTVTCLLGQDDYLPMAERYELVIDQGLTAISGTAIRRPAVPVAGPWRFQLADPDRMPLWCAVKKRRAWRTVLIGHGRSYTATRRTSVCRKYYVHPKVIDAYLDGSLAECKSTARPRRGICGEETAALRFLTGS